MLLPNSYVPPALRLARLPLLDRADLISRLSASELKQLNGPLFWAHRGQLVPGLFRGAENFLHPLRKRPYRYSKALVLTGRGFGKTQLGSWWIHDRLSAGHLPAALVGKTMKDVREVMVHGESGVIRLAPSARSCRWIKGEAVLWVTDPALRPLTTDDRGLSVYAYTGENTVQMRGPNVSTTWIDEWLFHDDPAETLKQAELFTRRPNSRILLTTTFSDSPAFWDLWKQPSTSCLCGLRSDGTFDLSARIPDLCTPNTDNDPETLFAHGSLLDNPYLPADYRERMERMAGTNVGRVEVLGLLTKTQGGRVWESEVIDASRVEQIGGTLTSGMSPDSLWRGLGLDEVWISLDPAVTWHAESDESGVVVVGLKRTMRQLKSGNRIAETEAYVLEDRSGRYDPATLGSLVAELSRRWITNRVLYESNQGGEYIATTLKNARHDLHLRKIHHSDRSKGERARDAYALYQLGRVHHVGRLTQLEKQMVEWDPEDRKSSPDRVDAVVNVLLQTMPPSQEIKRPSITAY